MVDDRTSRRLLEGVGRRRLQGVLTSRAISSPLPAYYHAMEAPTGLFTASIIVLRLSNGKKQTISFVFTIHGLHVRTKSPGAC